MKTKFSLIIVLAIAINSHSQINEFNEHIISTNAQDAWSVYAADLDGDLDLDVLSASMDDNKIAWYENINGLGDFGEEQLISDNSDGAEYVITADLNGDRYLDVLTVSYDGDKLVWYPNLNGSGDFGTENIITSTLDGARSIFAGDLDGDGDIDVLSASFIDDKVVWFKNIDNSGIFSTEIIIGDIRYDPVSVFASDLDGDGDLDVLAGSQLDRNIVWYKNIDGNGNFSSEILLSPNNFANSPRQITTADIDDDGDLDVLSANASGGGITWWENIDGVGNFEYHWIPFSIVFPFSVTTSDIDLDGDIDIIFPSMIDNMIGWYENQDGLGTFHTEEQFITQNAMGAVHVFAADMDGDGVSDILSASRYDNKIAWYENLRVLDINEFEQSLFLVSPIPTLDILRITSKSAVKQINILNELGQIILSNSHQDTIDVSNLSQGLYFVQLIDENNNSDTIKIIKS